MPRYELNLHIDNIGSRNDIRIYVETLNDQRRIYLRRPTFLHNSFDFVVCVEGINFNPAGRRRNYPTHDDILNDLKEKYNKNPKKYEYIYEALNAIYSCSYIDLEPLNSISFKSRFPCVLIIKTLKWLFIEQDIHYWNYSGRDMLWKGIYNINHTI